LNNKPGFILPKPLDLVFTRAYNSCMLFSYSYRLLTSKGKINMKYQYSRDTKSFKLQVALQAGEVVTASTAAKRFGIKNLSAEVSRVRQNGYFVAKSTRVAGNGVTVTEYKLAQPTREMIALAYKAQAAGLTV
jgi:hypothetical protein